MLPCARCASRLGGRIESRERIAILDEISRIRRFEMLFDNAEPSPIEDDAYAPYGNFGFPPPPPDRPWVYSNFVQSLDGITTLLEEERLRGPQSRGIVFQVADPTLRELRTKLGKSRERNIFVTRATDPDLSRYKVFDGDVVDAAILTSPAGAERLRAQGSSSHVVVVAAGDGEAFDLAKAIFKLREELGVQYLLCEGGPTLYGSLARADLVDEKFMTVSPIEVGQVVPPEQERLATEPATGILMRPTVFGGPGFTLDQVTHWTWMSCRKAGDHQFNRYRRKGRG